MTSLKKFYRKFWATLCTGVMFILLGATIWGQPAQPQPTSAISQQQTSGEDSRPSENQKSAGKSDRATQGQSSQSASTTQAETEHKISSKEAEELFRSVDEILKFASKDTGLAIRHEVKRRLTRRDEVVAYIEKHMAEDEDAQRLRRSELVLKKFGLLPRDFNLQTFLVALLREQVAGYYDPKTKTVNLLDWIDPERQQPVLAHELTHALQDQSFGLEKWMKAGMSDLEKKKDPTPADIESDEISAARQAVVEGQAMVVLIDYTLAPTGQSLLDSPQMVEALKAGMLVGTADSVQFQNAPIYLKEAIIFAYRYGLDFEAELLTKGGKEKAFAGAFTNPPRSTRQIMEPQTYLSGEETSKRLYPHWRGGYYYAARPKGDPTAPLGLLYVSRWSNAERAAEFAAVYAKSLAKRYKYLHLVAVHDKRSANHDDKTQPLTGKHVWLTEEGPIVIDVQGDTVLVSESLDQTTTDQVEQEVFGAATASK